MQLIRALYESFIRALIRFWDNRFIKNNDIDYFKLELEKQQDNYRELVLRVTAQPSSGVTEPEDETDWKPINKGYIPWSSKRAQLEAASRQRARELADEARMNIERAKSTEQLEKELLDGTDD